MSQLPWKFLAPLPSGSESDVAISTGDTLGQALYKLQGQISPIKDEIPALLRNNQRIVIIDMNELDYNMSAIESQYQAIVLINTGDGTKTLTLHDAPNNPSVLYFYIYSQYGVNFTTTDGNFTGYIDPGLPYQLLYGYQPDGGTVATFVNYVPYHENELLTPGTAVKVSFNKYGLITDTETATPADVGLGNVPNVDCTNAANISSGKISIDRLPASAVPTLKVVADQTARFALTTTDVQNGDTVKQVDTNMMYYVVDDTNLNNAAGYDDYNSVADWSAITNIPVPVQNLSGTNTGNETATSIGAIIAAASTKATLANADKFVISNSADSGISYSVSWSDFKTNIKTYTDTLYLEPGDVFGTTNQITATAGSGSTTLSLPSTLIAPGSVKATTTLEVGSATPLNLPNWIFQCTANVNSYTQMSLQNKSAGNAASSDMVLTADNGSDTTHYLDIGINSSTYNQAAYNIGGANDGYIYTASGHLTIGTAVAKDVIFHTGGTTSTNEVGRWKHGEGLLSKLGFVVTTAVNSFTTALGVALKVIPGAAATATSTGNTTTVQGGPGGSTSGAGGAVSIIGGTPVAGAGGSVTVAGAAGVGTNQNGGNLTIQGGAATGSGVAGIITAITAGVTRLIIGAAGGWTINSSEGTAKQVITSQGTASTPKWEWPSIGAAEFSTSAGQGNLSTSDTVITYDNTDISSSHVTKLAGNQTFEFQRAGYYEVSQTYNIEKTSAAGGSSIYRGRLQLSTNGAAFADITRSICYETSPNNSSRSTGEHKMTFGKTNVIFIPSINATKDRIRAVIKLDQDGGGTESCPSASMVIKYLGP